MNWNENFGCGNRNTDFRPEPATALRLLLLIALAAAMTRTLLAEPAAPGTKSESFDRDPGWEAINNRVVPEKPQTVVQDFGYSNTSYAGKATGEMGGLVWRASD